MLLRNQLYAGIVNVPEYGVRDKRGDFEPLISEPVPSRTGGAFWPVAECSSEAASASGLPIARLR
jgi:hypothetical protein